MGNISTPDIIRGVDVPKHIRAILDQNPYPSNPNALTPKYSAQLKQYQENTAQLEKLYAAAETHRMAIKEPLAMLQQQIDMLKQQMKELEDAHLSAPDYLKLRSDIRALEDSGDISDLGEYEDHEYPYELNTTLREDYCDWVVRMMTVLRETYTQVNFDELWRHVDSISECSSRYIGGGEYESVEYTCFSNKVILFVKLASMLKMYEKVYA